MNHHFGKLEIQREPLDLHALVRAVRDQLAGRAAARGITLELRLAEGVRADVTGDGARLRQCLHDITLAAITLARDRPIAIAVAPEEGREAILLGVTDRGGDIGQARLNRMLQTYMIALPRDASHGPDPGLANARHVVEMMGGRLSACHDVDTGTVFTMALPLEPAEGAARVAAPPVAAAPEIVDETPKRAGLRVLLAEDNATNRLVFDRMVQHTGVEIRTAHNGAEAIAAFVEDPPDLVFMDMSMPLMDGLTATREIRTFETGRGMAPRPIVALTANALESDREACLAAGMSDFLSKPFRRDALLEMLAKWAQGHPGAAGSGPGQDRSAAQPFGR